MISILLPFRNAEQTLGECLDSIQKQSFEPFEVIAVDDNSNDGSRSIVEKLDDERFRCSPNPSRGLVSALNFGLTLCQFDLIARMDADDLMASNRLSCQFEHFLHTPDLKLSATQADLFPEQAIKAGYKAYMQWQNQVLTHEQIRNNMFVESPFAHPSVMFEKSCVIGLGGYREGSFPEDYDLWLRLYEQGYRMEKLPSVLLHWRESPSRTSRTHPAYSREAFDQLRAEYLSRDPRLTSSRPIVVWGAGRKTRQRVKYLQNLGLTVSAWIDIDPKKIGNKIQNAWVYDPTWLASRSTRPFVLIYVTNHGAREGIETYLKDMGYECGQDSLSVG